MSGPGQQYILCLVRLNEDGTICESFLESAAPPLPRVSRAVPLGEEKARAVLMALAGTIDGLRGYLQAVAEVMPVSEDQDDMFDDGAPLNALTNMELALDSVVREFLRPASELLRRVAIVTDEDLRRDFDERHAKYRAARRRRD